MLCERQIFYASYLASLKPGSFPPSLRRVLVALALKALARTYDLIVTGRGRVCFIAWFHLEINLLIFYLCSLSHICEGAFFLLAPKLRGGGKPRATSSVPISYITHKWGAFWSTCSLILHMCSCLSLSLLSSLCFSLSNRESKGCRWTDCLCLINFQDCWVPFSLCFCFV